MLLLDERRSLVLPPQRQAFEMILQLCLVKLIPRKGPFGGEPTVRIGETMKQNGWRPFSNSRESITWDPG